MAGKGSQFEREICKLLSMWWTDGERDDIFWRTSQSGGRATSRRGRSTKYQHGDVTFTDPIGAPLIELFTIELKRGYSKANVHGVLDRQELAKQETFEAHVEQARKAQRAANTPYWMLIQRRNQRHAVVWVPSAGFTKFHELFGNRNRLQARFFLRCESGLEERTLTSMVGVSLADWVACVTPHHIKELNEMERTDD